MVGLYDYDNATAQQCLDDLQEIIEYFESCNFTKNLDLDNLEKKGQRIQYIVQRLKELGDGENG